MSLLNSSCCCATNLGRCCILDTTSPGVDCVDLCVDNKTPAQCLALGGVWEAGACNMIDPTPCVGVCCATTTAGYFVACQEGVTQCECFSDNLAEGVNTTWTSGPNLTCADIACPCQCSDSPCPCMQYIKLTTTDTTTTQVCDNTCSIIVVEVSVENAVNGAHCQAGGLFDACASNGTFINDLIAYYNSASSTETYVHCDDGRTWTHAIDYYAELGAIVCPNSLCTPTTIEIGINTFDATCSISGTGSPPLIRCTCNPIYPNSDTDPCIVPLPHCNTCGYENCVHEYDDCETC